MNAIWMTLIICTSITLCSLMGSWARRGKCACCHREEKKTYD